MQEIAIAMYSGWFALPADWDQDRSASAAVYHNLLKDLGENLAQWALNQRSNHLLIAYTAHARQPVFVVR